MDFKYMIDKLECKNRLRDEQVLAVYLNKYA